MNHALAQRWCHASSQKCGGGAQVNPNAIIVSRRQEGNPLLRHIRNVRWQHGDILPDYQMGPGTCALFLSLRRAALAPADFPDMFLSGAVKMAAEQTFIV